MEKSIFSGLIPSSVESRCVDIASAANKQFQCNFFTGPSNSNCMLANPSNCSSCRSGSVKTASPPGQCVFLISCTRPVNNNGINYNTCPSPIPKNSNCNADCSSGYYVNGSLLVSCNNVGNITLPTGNCLPNPCNMYANTASTLYSTTCSNPLPSGEFCTPICNNGYSNNNSLTISCNLGILSTPNATCLPNPCIRPADTLSTLYTISSCPLLTSHLSTCIPTCKSGYISSDSLSLTCYLGNFMSSVGVCLPSPCFRPNDTESTIYENDKCPLSTIPLSDSCTPICAKGYTAIASLSMTCTAGVLSIPVGICIESPCLLISPNYPFTDGSCSSSTSTATIPSRRSCFLGCAFPTHVASGSLEIMCTKGVFSSPDSFCVVDSSQSLCSQPTPNYPLNPGTCAYSSNNGTICSLGCNNGSTATGDLSVICKNQLFQQLYPQSLCLENPCLSLPIDITGLIGINIGNCSSSVTKSGDSCLLSCENGYDQIGPLDITCTLGSFSSPLGVCQPKQCLQPLDMLTPSSKLTVGNCAGLTDSGSSCELGCIDGFTPFGNFTVNCLLSNFSRVGVGYCIGVSEIKTSFSSTLSSTSSLIVSPGTTLQVILDCGDFSNIIAIAKYVEIRTQKLLDFILPEFEEVSSKSVLKIDVYINIPSLFITNALLYEYTTGSMIYVILPTLNNVCPETLQIQVYKTLTIGGIGFENSFDSVRCILDGIYVGETLSVAPDSVTCLVYYPVETNAETITLHVANDGSINTTMQLPLIITLTGSCSISKPKSIPNPDHATSTLIPCICPPGTYDTGASCEFCPAGTFQDTYGTQSRCISCGDNQNTGIINNVGFTTATACVCVPDYFLNPDFISDENSNERKCLECVDGMICPGDNIVKIEKGYWRANENTQAVLECPGREDTCAGTQPFTTSLCVNGTTGPLCSVCTDGYAKIGDICVECPSDGVNILLLMLLMILFIVILVVFVKLSYALANENKINEDNNSNNSSSGDLGSIIKVTMNFFQVLYYIGRLSANWSPIVKYLFEVLGASTVSTNFISIQCAAKWSFYDQLVFTYFSPIIFTFFIAIVYIFRHLYYKLERKQSFDDFQFTVMLLLYLMHPNIMLEVISSLKCEKIAGTGTSYLSADMSVDCNNQSYVFFALFSSIYLIFYIFGLMALVCWRLYHNATTNGKLFNSDHSSFRKYSFFVKGFKDEVYYWEAIVMLRKLLIVIIATTIISPLLQLVWSSVTIVISLFQQILKSPFSIDFVNSLEKTSLIVLIIVILIGFHFQVTDDNITPTVILLLITIPWSLFLIGCCFLRLKIAMFNFLSAHFKYKLFSIKKSSHTRSKEMTGNNIIRNSSLQEKLINY